MIKHQDLKNLFFPGLRTFHHPLYMFVLVRVHQVLCACEYISLCLCVRLRAFAFAFVCVCVCADLNAYPALHLYAPSMHAYLHMSRPVRVLDGKEFSKSVSTDGRGWRTHKSVLSFQRNQFYKLNTVVFLFFLFCCCNFRLVCCHCTVYKDTIFFSFN